MEETITIRSMEPRVFGVQVTQGKTTTSHRVTVSDDVLDQVAIATEREDGEEELEFQLKWGTEDVEDDDGGEEV